MKKKSIDNTNVCRYDIYVLIPYAILKRNANDMVTDCCETENNSSSNKKIKWSQVIGKASEHANVLGTRTQHKPDKKKKNVRIVYVNYVSIYVSVTPSYYL